MLLKLHTTHIFTCKLYTNAIFNNQYIWVLWYSTVIVKLKMVRENWLKLHVNTHDTIETVVL